jgi:hypothetical protein
MVRSELVLNRMAKHSDLNDFTIITLDRFHQNYTSLVSSKWHLIKFIWIIVYKLKEITHSDKQLLASDCHFILSLE